MLASPRHIESLIVSAASSRLDKDSVLELVYLLTMPGRTIPIVVASVLADRPAILSLRSLFPVHLAFGTVNYTLLRDGFDTPKLRRIARQIGFIRVYLLEAQRSPRVMDVFRDRLVEFEHCVLAARELSTGRTLAPPERAALTEHLVLAATDEAELLKLLLRRILGSLTPAPRRSIADSVRDAVRQGLENIPWDDSEPELIRNLDEPLRFRKSLFDNPTFIRVARSLPDIVEESLFVPAPLGH